MQEMALLSHKTEPVGDESLKNWEPVGSGGFGHVYKARHENWGFDVAIKILHDGVSPLPHCSKLLREEAYHMDKGSCEFVLRLYGTYQGCPRGVTSPQQGLVMEFMGRGSVQSLLEHLSGPSQWPLVCRLAHQVALGMNFLHSQKIMHHDLKPSNVLLNDDLNARLADFGLSRVPTSALNSNREKSVMIGGSYKYMPPEAFEVSYEPHRAFDIYSYGILLWSIINGKEPYRFADRDLVELKIPRGDRPCCKEIDLMSERKGLKELVHLMKRCWDGSPNERPTFKVCFDVTENVFSKHKSGIHDVVGQVLKRLNSPTSNQSNTSVAFNVPPQTPEQSMSNDTVDNDLVTKTERSSKQDCVGISTRRMSSTEKAKFVDDNRKMLIRYVTMVMPITDELDDMVHPEAYDLIRVEATNQDKMRELYKTLYSGGEVVKAAFYDALEIHEKRLVLRLDG